MLINTINKIFLFILFFLLIANNAYSEIIKKIEIRGNNRIPDETIKMLTNVKVNDDISQNDINNLIKNLYETNFFENIQIKFSKNILIITTKENPIISNIKIKGIKAKRIKEDINKVLTLREKSSFNEVVIFKEKEKVSNLLKNQGYISSEINILKENLDDNKINLIFDINLGEKAKIKKISFIGKKIFKDQKLKNVIVSEEYKFWKFLSGKKYLNETLIDFDKQLLKNFFFFFGYYNVSINSSFAKQINTDEFELIFNIEANEKVIFRNLNLELPSDYNSENFSEINDLFEKLKGENYSINKIKDILDKIDQIVLEEQFETIKASVEENLVDNKLDLKFVILETEKLLVEKINIFGNNITEEIVIRNQLLVDEGDPYNEILKTKSINNLKSLNFFKNVNSEIIDGSSEDLKIINIFVDEKPTGEVMAGAGFGTTGSSIFLGVKENNFLGKGISLDSNLNISSESINGLFSIENRNYKNTDKSLFLTVDASETDRLKNSGYKFNRTGFDVGTRFEYYDDFYLKLGSSNYYERIETDNTASARQQAQEGDYLDLFLNISATYDKRNQKFQTSDGFLSSYSVDLPYISETYSLINKYKYKYFTELYENNVSSFSLSLRSAHSLKNEDIKLSERLRVPSSLLRGFEFGKVGPKDGDDYIGGNYMVAVNFSSTLPQVLENSQNTDFLIFVDAANLWGVDYNSSLDDNEIRSSVGIALDWFSPVGPMNFSLAQPLTKSDNDVTESFRFNLGTTF